MGREGPTFASEGTRLVWQIYPKTLRETLYERGWEGPQDHPNLVWLEAKDLPYATCSDDLIKELKDAQ